VNKNNIYKVGGYACLVVFILSTIFPTFIIALTLPLYFLGIYLIRKTDLSKEVKSNWYKFSLLPLAVWLLVSLIVVLQFEVQKSRKRAEEDYFNRTRVECRFVIDEQFTKSKIMIISNKKYAEPGTIIKKNVIQYDIPDNGIIIIKEHLRNEKPIKFFLRNLDGKLEQLADDDHHITIKNELVVTGSRRDYKTTTCAKDTSQINYLVFKLTDDRTNRTIDTADVQFADPCTIIKNKSASGNSAINLRSGGFRGHLQ
jgi:hypothetical protein